MADETEGSVAGRPKREPPTIDLQATEAPPEAGAEPPPAPEQAASVPLWRQGPVIAGAGIAAVAAIGFGLWAVMPGGSVDVAQSDTADRLARLETQLRDLAGRPPAAAEPKGLDDLAARLGKLESALASPRATTDAALANRLAAAEAETKALANGVANLARRADEQAAALREARDQAAALTRTVGDLAQQKAGTVGRADLDALGQRIAALEAAAKSLTTAIANASDRAARHAAAAIALKAAVDRGAPFRAELAAVKPFAGDPQPVAALEPFAGSGIPSVAALLKEFAARLPEIQQSVNVSPTGSGILGRLQANAERLVRVRPLNDAQGDEAAAVAARLETRIGQGDLAGAVAEAGKLPPDARKPLEPLIAKSAARAGALAAAERLNAEALAGLAQPAAAK